MVAVFLPMRYNRICTLKWSAVVVISGMLYGIAVNVTDVITGCRFVYDFHVYSWGYQDCSQMVIYFEFVYPVMSAGATSLAAHIFIAITLIIKGMHMGAVLLPRNKNTRLFWQGFAQELFFANDLLWQQFLSDLFDSPWWLFLSCTFMWELAHTCDGLMFLIFDTKMRMSIQRCITQLRFPIPEGTISSIT
ncbi:hypothetical protein Y032_0005g2737 [Ancylostoma ceylanicum]|uniref:7TM GPCR serpentine receptor class x (Srx) domain-containing protein n=1 Tax=Ancylostoma ceylanicum TaxID=53326 RepID=A0A016VT79_9BILA|nr:hypothetical protein Y032_0005g2737 [Ancylostoma ceylanicum]